MALSTFNAVVTSTNTDHQYIATARDFKVNFVGKGGDKNHGITPEEGILAALGSCETIVTAGVYTENHKKFNNFKLGLNLTQNIFHVAFFLNDEAKLFSKIKQAIIDTSPVYDNIVRAIPIETAKTKAEK